MRRLYNDSLLKGRGVEVSMKPANRLLLVWAPPMVAMGVSFIVRAIAGVIYIEGFSIVQGLWAACESVAIFSG